MYFVVCLISRYQSNPRPPHWQAVNRIIRYLCGTIDLIICYHSGDLKLGEYSDVD